MSTNDEFIKLPLRGIVWPKKNPNHMDPEQFRLLVAAVKRFGRLLQPVLVREAVGLDDLDEAEVCRLRADNPELSDDALDTIQRLQPSFHRLVDGVHRVLAARAAGLTEVPAVVVSVGADEAAALQIGMNRLRGELNLAEVAECLRDLHDDGWSSEQLAMSGFSGEELDALLRANMPTTEDVLGGGLGAPPTKDEDEEPAPERVWKLDLEFATRAQLMRVKKALRHAAGKGKPLGEGLLRLLDAQG